MREEPTRSLLLLDANPEERRLISAIAGRAGWSVVGAADEEMALALLQGPHGREVLTSAPFLSGRECRLSSTSTAVPTSLIKGSIRSGRPQS